MKLQLSTLSVITREDVPLALIQFTRPDQLNSFIPEQYHELTTVLSQLDSNDNVSVVVLTGSGPYYSSGQDLSNQARRILKEQSEGNDLGALFTRTVRTQAYPLVEQFIDFSKPIIAAVNGPAMGIAVTTLALCDVVYASETATFSTPFMKLGFCAEGCSSILFPQIMGISKANELLLLGKSLTAQEAERCNLVSSVFPSNTLMDEVLQRASLMASFPPNALKQTKSLIRAPVQKLLHEVNDREMTCLVGRFMSEESKMAVIKFMMEKSKKKAANL